MYFIGIDLGTSSTKLLLVDDRGIIVNTVSKEYPLRFPHPGWSEQDPEDWWNACVTGIPELLKGFDASDVVGIAAGGQMHGLVALDRNDKVIRPAILWNDGRTQAEVDYLNEEIGKKTISDLTANIAFAGFTAPKLLWMRKHEPENFAVIAKIMLPKDFLNTVADNLEADLGMCYNVTAPLDFMPFDKEVEIARKVREVVTVGRVVVFGGTGNTMDDLYAAEEIREGKYIGIASAKSKSYDQGYQCLHLGYGVDPKVQAPTILTESGIDCTLIGKVADIVHNEGGTSISCVPTAECMDLTLEAMKKMDEGFICTNIQETDLAGHSQSSTRYREILEIADAKLPYILDEMKDDDFLVIMADHGNDPDIGHSKHTRECVPLLIRYKDYKGVHVGLRKTLSDVGASVCDYFDVKAPQNGTSFYREFK